MMKPGSIGDPDLYLGAKLRKVQLDNGVFAWSFSSSSYAQEDVRNVERYLDASNTGRKLTKRTSSPWPCNYAPELDTTPELDSTMATYYQSEVSVLQWIVQLGRFDIITEVSTLASHMALPREGHLEAMYHVFAYVKNKHNARSVFDPTYPEINTESFITHDWKNFYGNVKEELPHDAPPPRG